MEAESEREEDESDDDDDDDGAMDGYYEKEDNDAMNDVTPVVEDTE